MRMILRYFTRGDIVIIVALLIVSAAGFAGMGRLGLDGKHVVVEVDGVRTLELSLDRNVRETVTGPLGETVIAVENGTVRVDDSPCPHHYCERMGAIDRRGEIIVCVPNRVVISITSGNEEDSLDGVTQ